MERPWPVFKNLSQPSCAVLPERSGVVNLLNRSHLKVLKKLPSLSGHIEPGGAVDGHRCQCVAAALWPMQKFVIACIVHLAPLCDNIFRKIVERCQETVFRLGIFLQSLWRINVHTCAAELNGARRCDVELVVCAHVPLICL